MATKKQPRPQTLAGPAKKDPKPGPVNKGRKAGAASTGRKAGAANKNRKAEPTPSPQAEQAKPQGKKVGALDAAARVLAETGAELTCKELIEKMAALRYWTSPGGKTPQSTLYAAILRELKTKGAKARFQKTGRGKFALIPAGGKN